MFKTRSKATAERKKADFEKGYILPFCPLIGKSCRKDCESYIKASVIPFINSSIKEENTFHVYHPFCDCAILHTGIIERIR